MPKQQLEYIDYLGPLAGESAARLNVASLASFACSRDYFRLHSLHFERHAAALVPRNAKRRSNGVCKGAFRAFKLVFGPIKRSPISVGPRAQEKRRSKQL